MHYVQESITDLRVDHTCTGADHSYEHAKLRVNHTGTWRVPSMFGSQLLGYSIHCTGVNHIWNALCTGVNHICTGADHSYEHAKLRVNHTGTWRVPSMFGSQLLGYSIHCTGVNHIWNALCTGVNHICTGADHSYEHVKLRVNHTGTWRVPSMFGSQLLGYSTHCTGVNHIWNALCTGVNHICTGADHSYEHVK